MVTKQDKFCKQNESESKDLAEILYYNPPPDGIQIELEDVSEKDKGWKKHKNENIEVKGLYLNPQIKYLKHSSIFFHYDMFNKYAFRMQECARVLLFGFEEGFKLKEGLFCHVRNCPICQWRKSLKWKAKMIEVYKHLKGDYPTHRWLMLTLTTKNCHISELREELKKNNDAWKKLTKRKEFASVVGWFRATEVTRDKKRPATYAHPHFHVMLLVKPSYFAKNYVKQMEWVRAWAECLEADYMPNVDIRVVKAKANKSNTGQEEVHEIMGAVAESSKYALKPADMTGASYKKSLSKSQSCEQYKYEGEKEVMESMSIEDRLKYWFLEYTVQVHRLRFIATGGVVKSALKNLDLTEDDSKDEKEDLLLTKVTDEAQSEVESEYNKDKRRIAFKWDLSKYLYNPAFNT